jgi:WD40 repeat protein
MRAHRQRPSSYRAARTERAGGSSIGRRLARAAVLAATLVLSSGTTLAVLPPPAAAEECPNAAFRTGPSTHLPDCRAYEMVTPPYKASGHFAAAAFTINPSGSSLLLDITSAINGAEGFPNILGIAPGEVYTTRRTASGWVDVPDDLPLSEYIPYRHNGFTNYGYGGGESSEGQATVWMDRGAWQPDNELDFFMRAPDHSIVDIGPALPPTAPAESPQELGTDAGLGAIGLSPDGSHYFFSLGEGKDSWPAGGNVYEYAGTGNTTPMPVGVDNGGKRIGCGATFGGDSTTHNAASTDGEVVFFTAEPGCTGGIHELFARVDNGLPDAHTVAISEPSKEDCAACDTEAKVLASAQFGGASEDGSKVFFTTTQPLLSDDTSLNVYEYDFEAPAGERVIRVSAGDATVSNPAAEVVPMQDGRSPMNSEDGSHVYFVAHGLLTRTPNGEGETAQQSAENLYVFERDAQFPNGRISFVARLSESDVGGWMPDATPDGRFLVFASYRDLTPDDTSTAAQIFEYDAQTGSLVRVSSGQEGFNHNGNVSLLLSSTGQQVNNASIVSPVRYDYGNEYHPSAYWSNMSVSADGSYVFFQSAVGLTPQALNQQVIGYTPESSPPNPLYANNIYEYHDGRVSLISDFQDLSYSNSGNWVELVSTDASGDDVYFVTTDSLVGQDTDTSLDLYDARIDGGFPAPVQPFTCSGEACEGQLSGAPTLRLPGSEFQAGGNPPLAGEPTAKLVPTVKKKKAKKRRAGKGRGRTTRRVGKAKRAAVGGRANREGGRS